MRFVRRQQLCVWLACCWACCCLPVVLQAEEVAVLKAEAVPEAVSGEVSPALRDYVRAEDDSFRWKLLEERKLPASQAKVIELELVSQTWQGIVWKHSLVIFEPAELLFPEHALLFVSGGSINSKIREGDLLAGSQLAHMTGTRCVYLLQVPNQPIMGGKYEDDLISDTFLNYLETRDPSWPLLFPMVKSAVRAMDAVQEFTAGNDGKRVEKFIVTGASKRGWTSWLTGVADRRVVGIAPIVIDTLNIPRQMDHQIATWGKYSEQIEDYTSKGLVQVMKEQPDIPLWRWVDPYTYREQLTLPKLLINGTNDRYWVLDALNNYWDDLRGVKQVLYVPNAGHSLKGGQHLALVSLAAFVRHLAADVPFPEWSWEHTQEEGRLKLQINSSGAVKSAKLWTARSETKDFREAQWTSKKMTANEAGFVGEIPVPVSGHTALYGEVQLEVQGLKYSLTTQVHVE